VIERLLASDEPSIRRRARNRVLRQPFDADLSEEVRSSARVRSLTPLRERVLSWLFSEKYTKRWIPKSHGLCRMHASQDANAIWKADDRQTRG
jgi:hypothetical protein